MAVSLHRTMIRLMSSLTMHRRVMCLSAGASAGWGFVKFATVDGARSALSTLNGFQFGGKSLKVAISRPRSVSPPPKFVPRKHCTQYCNGACPRGEACTFLHEDCELDAQCMTCVFACVWFLHSLRVPLVLVFSHFLATGADFSI
jgi:hypothetical protein